MNQLNGHAVVCGYGHLGSRITMQLRERGCEVVVVSRDLDDTARQKMQSLGCRFIEGDIRDDTLLVQAGVESAECVLITSGDDCANLEAAISVRQINPHVTVVVRLFDQTLARRVENMVDVQALSASFLATPAFVSAATDASIAAAFNIDDCSLTIGHCGCGKNGGYAKGLYVIRNDSGLHVSRTRESDACRNNCLVASVSSEDHRPFSKIKKKSKKRMRPAKKLLHFLHHLRPAQFFRDMAAVWKQSSAITRNIAGALAAVAVFSVLVLSLSGKMHPFDAICFVIVAMTTSDYAGIDVIHESLSFRLFGIVMMLCGTALMATLYAIIAEYVLSARMEYLLGRRRVDARDHTVVVGLGKIGYRVAHDLKLLGIDVVAIETNDDSDNVSAARGMFPVIIGDASRPSILQNAGIETAGVLLALTDDPMLNLSVALHAKEQNPAIRTILRTYDTDLAEKLRSFGLDQVLSTSAIAAPAFVDSALYPGVQGSFHLGNEDVLVATHTIERGSKYINKSVAAVGSDSGIAVVMVSDSHANPYRLATPETLLCEGQKVVLMLSRDKVEKLRS